MKQHKICIPLYVTVLLFAFCLYFAIPAAAHTAVLRATSGVVPMSEESSVKGITPISPITPIEPIHPNSEISPITPIEPIKPIEPVSEIEPITPIKPITPNSQVTQHEENSASGPVTVLSSQLHEMPAGGTSGQSATSEKSGESSMSTPLTILLTVIIFIVGFTGALFAVNPELRRILARKKPSFLIKKNTDNNHS